MRCANFIQNKILSLHENLNAQRRGKKMMKNKQIFKKSQLLPKKSPLTQK